MKRWLVEGRAGHSVARRREMAEELTSHDLPRRAEDCPPYHQRWIYCFLELEALVFFNAGA
jgi:hypothetical protein